MNLVPQNPRPVGASNGLRANAPNGFPNRGGAKPAASVDLLGPLLRRKYIVILLALIGAGVGWFVFERTPATFQSSARLMIWSQAPPRLSNEDQRRLVPQISIEKYMNLLGSQLVLDQAISKGELSMTSALATSDSPLQSLREILTIKDESAESLLVSVEGPDREELPKILNEVYTAFTSIIEADQKQDGQESIELIDALQRRLQDEKDVAERRYLELLNQLGVAKRDSNGSIVNPHAAQMNRLEEQIQSEQAELDDVVSRINALNTAIQSENATALRVTALQGQQYMGLDSRPLPSVTSQQSRLNHAGFEFSRMTTQRINSLEGQLDTIRLRLLDLDIQKTELELRYGPRYQAMIQLERQTDQWQAEADRIREKIKEVQDEWTAEYQANSDEENSGLDWDEFRENQEKEWLALYGERLNHESARIRSTLAKLQPKFADYKQKASDIAAAVEEANILGKRIEEKRNEIQSNLDRLASIGVRENYNEIKVRMVDEPNLGEKIAPSLLKCLGIGIFLLGLLGCGMAVLIDMADHSFRSPDEIADLFHAPVVGRVPRIRGMAKAAKLTETPSLIALHRPNSPAGEAIRAIRTGMLFTAASEGANTFLFTSPSPGDGKSTTAANLAISIAQAGKRVCLIDCDLRRPRIHKYFAAQNSVGIKEVVDEECELSDALQNSCHPNLKLLTAGRKPANPGEFITSPRVIKLIEYLKTKFDFVLVDSPPVLPVADPMVLAAQMDCTYVVLRIRKGVTVTAQRTVENLSRVDAKVAGVIVNGVDQNPYYNEYGYYYGFDRSYGYGYGYGENENGNANGNGKPMNGKSNGQPPRLPDKRNRKVRS